MRYFKNDVTPIEITKTQARNLLTGYWTEKVLDEIFCYEYNFRLNTPYSVIWTMDKHGRIPSRSDYGIWL